MKPYFDLALTNPPRTMTRNEWHASQHWLRSARRIIMKQLPLEKINRKATEVLIYGRTL